MFLAFIFPLPHSFSLSLFFFYRWAECGNGINTAATLCDTCITQLECTGCMYRLLPSGQDRDALGECCPCMWYFAERCKMEREERERERERREKREREREREREESRSDESIKVSYLTSSLSLSLSLSPLPRTDQVPWMNLPC